VPVSFEFLRGVLAVCAVIFAHLSGRSAMAVRKGTQKLSRLYGWILRAVAAAGAIIVKHPVDGLIIGIWAVCLLAFAIGWWDAGRPRKVDDLTISPE
jgi:hypothetical protein